MIRSTTADRRRAAVVRGGIVAVFLLASPSAFAQRSAGDQAAADALYNEGRDLLKAGRTAAGCAKFEASLALSPAASTMINIARCHEQDGKLATAFADYTRALSLNGDTPGVERRKELEDLARRGLHALDPRLPRLRLLLTSPPPGVQVWSDGKEIPLAALGEALPADPGPHQVRVIAPGYHEETRTVTLEEGKTAAIEIALQKGSEPGASRGGWSRPTGIALLAVGAVGLGVGAVTGGISLSKVSAIRSSKSCPEYPHCPVTDTTDMTTRDTALTLGNVSTASLVAGGVLAAAGVVLLAVRPGGETRSSGLAGGLRVSVGTGHIDVRGRF